MKILILMSYYNRPKLVRNTLTSILKASEKHDDWCLSLADDGSDVPVKPIVEEILAGHMHKVVVIETKATLEDKLERGLSLGGLANREMKASDAGAAIMLCDDDELHPDYLKNLSDYFDGNDVLYCYSKIHLFNPLYQKTGSVNNLTNKYNQWSAPINPANRVDASQVAWRLKCCKEMGAWFSESTASVPGKPWVKDTDKSFFENLFDKCGPCHPTRFVSQYKGVHDYQLLWHKNTGPDGLRNYNEVIRELAGVLF